MMSEKRALEYWKSKYEKAKDYYDDHWDASEYKEFMEYIEALQWAVQALEDDLNMEVPE